MVSVWLILVFCSTFTAASAQDWQEYVDKHLIGSRAFTQAAIAGLDGAIWASSPGFQLSEGEVGNIVQVYENPSIRGVTVTGINYDIVSLNDRSLYGVRNGQGVLAFKTNNALVIGAFRASRNNMQNAKMTINKLGEYITSIGF